MIRILHVDDNQDDRILTKMKLERISSDILVEGVESVEEAIAILAWENFDCILSDFQMPGEDGFHLLKTIRKENNNIPFVFYTGQGNEALAVEVFRAGADDYFTKDVGFAHYERMVNSIKRVIKYYRQFVVRQKEKSALERSQRRLMNAQRLARMSSWEWDFKSDEFNCSDEFFNILKVDGVQYTDRSKVLNHFPPSEQLRFKKDVLMVMRGAEIKLNEYRILDQNQKELILLISMAPVKEKDSGIVVRVEGVAQDVTERKAVEKQAKTHKERLTLTQKLGELGSWELDLADKTISVSDNTRKILGFRENEVELTVEMILQKTLPEYRSHLEKTMLDSIAGKGDFGIQFEIYGENPGESKIIHSNGKVELDTDDKAVKVIGAIQDITRLRVLEMWQENQQKRLREILLSFDRPVAEVDLKGAIVGANLSFRTTFRCDEIRDISLIFPGIDPILLDSADVNPESKVLLQAFNQKEYLLNILPVTIDFAGKATFLLIFSDIESADSLLPGEGEPGFSILKDFLPVGLYRTSGTGEYLYANEALAQILGCRDVDDLKSRNAYDFYPDQLIRQQKLNKWILRDGVSTVETKLKTTKGKIIWAKESGTVFLNDDGTINHIVGLIQDVTEHKHSEIVQATMYEIANEANRSGDLSDLFKSIHHHLSKLIDTTNFYIALYEGDDNYLFPYVVDLNEETLNERMNIRKGLTSHVLKSGKPLLINEDEIKQMVFRGEIEMIGAPAACWMGVPLVTEDETIGVLAVQNYDDQNKFTADDLDIFTFISGQVANAIERKISEKQLISQRDELASTNKELESFSYTVSHDLKAPLRHITGYCNMLADSLECGEDTDEAKYFQGILNSTERMDGLINDILKLSRSSSLEMNKVNIDFSSISEQVVEANSEEIRQRKIEIEIEPGLSAWGDAHMMRLVMENLIGNAIKFTGKVDEPVVRIGREIIDGEETFFVKDNGAGFDIDRADSIFLAFKRLHTNKEFQGTGIGLATVKRVINRHKGRIWAEAEVEKGATFYFYLPPDQENRY